MRLMAFCTIMCLLASGCISSPDKGKPSEQEMDNAFSDALGGATSSTEASLSPTPSTSFTASTSSTLAAYYTSTTRQSTTTTRHTFETIPGLMCGDVETAIGAADCERATCPQTGYRCHYIPGSFVSGQGSCSCRKVTTTT
jgi:hypothetical protein